MSTSNENEHGSVGMKVPKITKNISKEEFSNWESLFGSYALVKGFGIAVTSDEIPGLPTKHPSVLRLTGTDSEVKKKKRAVYLNDLCVAYLKLATADNRRAGKCFVKCCNEDYPQGKATEFLKLLRKKFGPKLGFRGTNLRAMLSKVKWNENNKEGTTKFFEDIATIQMMAKLINSKVLIDQDYIDHLVSVLPDKYKPTVQPLLKNNNVDIDDIEDAIVEYDEFWGRGDLSISSSDEESEEDEAALGGVDKSGPRCYNCQEYGHYARNCPKKAKGDGRKKVRFNGKCNHCGKVGHKEVDCWEKEENADKRPKNWKNNNDTALANTELVLCNVNGERLEDEVTLAATGEYYPTDKYMFIADSGATADVMSYVDHVKQNGLNVKGKQIIDNGGKKLSPTIIGTYSFIQMDKNGNEVNKGKLKNVWAGSAFEYNLFSIPKRLKDGWTMSGNKKCITLTKGKSEIKFDIVMNVGGSVLYGTILKPKADEVAAAAMQKAQANKPISILEAHLKFGHTGEGDVRKTAKACGLRLKQGSLQRCESCAIAKAKQKSVPCISEGKKGN